MSRSSEPLVETVDTPVGPARLTVHTPQSASYAGHPVGTLALGHGAGGGIAAIDLVAATQGALAAGWRVVLFEQPWRVAGRKVAVAPPRLDQAWRAGLAGLPREPLVLGGRSAGARVACRTASELHAIAVVALAFPLHPPGRADDPARSRAGELAMPGVPLLVVQGRRDPFGTAAQVRAALAEQAGPRVVVELNGDHALAADPGGVSSAVRRFLDDLPTPECPRDGPRCEHQ